MDRETIAILTLTIRLYRKLRQMGIYQMPLEFKGIKANSLRLMANHSKLTKTLSDAVESSDKLISHVGDFKTMSDQIVDDIEFAANVLGNSNNSGGASGDSSEVTGESKQILVTQQPPIKNNAPAAISESPRGIPQIGNVSPEHHTRDSNGHIIEK